MARASKPEVSNDEEQVAESGVEVIAVKWNVPVGYWDIVGYTEVAYTVKVEGSIEDTVLNIIDSMYAVAQGVADEFGHLVTEDKPARKSRGQSTGRGGGQSSRRGGGRSSSRGRGNNVVYKPFEYEDYLDVADLVSKERATDIIAQVAEDMGLTLSRVKPGSRDSNNLLEEIFKRYG